MITTSRADGLHTLERCLSCLVNAGTVSSEDARMHTLGPNELDTALR